MRKDRTTIVAIMGFVGLLIQLGFDPFGLMTVANKAANQAGVTVPSSNSPGTFLPGNNNSNPYQIPANQSPAYPQGFPNFPNVNNGNASTSGYVNQTAPNTFPAGYQNNSSYGNPSGYANAPPPSNYPTQYSQPNTANYQPQPNYGNAASNGNWVSTNNAGAIPGGGIATVPFDQRSLLIASFNIQVFGRSKLGNSSVVQILVDLVKRFDLVAVQEIRSTEQDILDRFLNEVNRGGGTYRYVMGERQGYTVSKEQYAFIYDAAKLEVIRQPGILSDPTNTMHRPPFATQFRSRELPVSQAITFTLLNVHTDPDHVPNELKALESVFAVARQQFPAEDDLIVLGDFNAPTSFLQNFRWLNYQSAAIRDDWATNTREDRNYDNLVFDGQATSEFTGRSGVVNFRAMYQLNLDNALQVSDHFPVWAEFSIFENAAR